MIKWDHRYSIEQQEIDTEHHLFFNLCNKINMACAEDTSDKWIRRVLMEIQRYAAYHFVSEENLMLLNNYPHLEEHRGMHNYLMDTFRDKLLAYEEGRCTLREIDQFLFNWLALHISNEDKKFGQYLKEKGDLSQ